ARKDRALPDGERGSGLDRGKPRRETAEFVAVRAPQSPQCGPGLARSRDELPLVDADRTRTGRSLRRRILRTAGRTDECRHDLPVWLLEARRRSDRKSAPKERMLSVPD